ncbi:double-stranded RNA-specific editase 1 [Diabrotica virgifera virgifera]|uniref:Double-stranded RNA-specific editase 1 n=1 Tax=Diabrotica virgifera virgifera TaxID=50390 RepID=A0A6P7G2J4_DIAVI|nr:double-stranded RNA-specific editase 1 [Diabrotica virgifera virgifera]
MSYSTRRSTGYNTPQTQNVGNVGQRRPVVTNNFVQGQQKPPQQQQQQQVQQNKPTTPATARPQATTPQAGIQFRAQQQTPQANQQAATTQAAANAARLQQQAQAQQIKHDADQSMDATNGSDSTEVKKKPFWANKTGSKVTKRERVRRRNVRLSKILQPKNAVMILNELVRNTSYTVDELSQKYDGNQFKATVLYEGIEHVGYGRSKINAKNTAAEAALKHYVKTNKLTEVKKDDEGNEKMDVSEDDATQAPLPWQHVASFALYKLFSSWGEDLNVNQNQSIPSGEKLHENKPAKKMPENPDTINPLMLVNQMLPQAQFEEIGKTGNPPNVLFSFKCIVDGESFIGTGSNKKAAKKMAAFGACSKVLGIQYPPDVYVSTK